MRNRMLWGIGVILLLATGAHAGPHILSYQGTLYDDRGRPVRDGGYDIQFRLFGNEIGGVHIWEEVDAGVEVTNGMFATILGDGTRFTTAEFAGDYSLYLEVAVDLDSDGTFAADETYEPRQRVAGAAWAMDADRLSGRWLTDLQLRVRDTAPAGHFITGINWDGTITTAADQTVTDTITGIVCGAGIMGGGTSGDVTVAADTTYLQRRVTGVARRGEYLRGINADGSIITGADMLTAASDFGRSGVSPDLYEGTETLTDKYLNAVGPDEMEGIAAGNSILRVRNRANGNAISGVSTGTQSSVFGWAQGSGGKAVAGLAGASDDVTNYGGFFTAWSKNAHAVHAEAPGDQGWAVYGKADGFNGRAVVGEATHKGTDFTYGGHFVSNSRQGRGVYGEAVNNEDGERPSCGGEFVARAPSGIGVRAIGWGAEGIGVYGSGADSSGQAANYGGYFRALGGGGCGVYAQSRATGVHAVGSSLYGVGVRARGGDRGHAAVFEGNVLLRSLDTGLAVMELGEGLDVAEGFDVTEPTASEPGTVLVIDAASPGRLAVSRSAYDRKVAGVVAGAKGLNSGVRLGAGQFDCNVALAGRVYCKVDATGAAVAPGDLLTTSDTPGYAMKAADHARSQGAILGKAMEPLERGRKGQILVLVTLQ